MAGNDIKMKKVKTYIEDDYQTAYAKARRELGYNLVIVEKKEVAEGGVFGLFSKKRIRVTFGIEAVRSKSESEKRNGNKEIMDLLNKMGYDTNGNKKREDLEEVKVSGDTYSPYKNMGKTVVEKKEENIEKIGKREEIEGIKEELKKEITEEIKKELFEKGISRGKESEQDRWLIWKKLEEQEIDNNIILEIKELINKEGINEKESINIIRNYFIKNILVYKGLDKEKLIMLVGPTGVGKTTSCAKIVANKWREEKNVAFITADTYRLGAISQLKAYANIMKVPVEVVNRPEDLTKAIDNFSDKDFIVMDTAGRSPKNKEQMDELRSYVNKRGEEVSVHLVLSSTSKAKVIYDTIEKFEYIGFKSIIFTKLDETTSVGALLNINKRYNIPVSYITTGQKVPDDIEEANKDYIAELFIKGLS